MFGALLIEKSRVHKSSDLSTLPDPRASHGSLHRLLSQVCDLTCLSVVRTPSPKM